MATAVPFLMMNLNYKGQTDYETLMPAAIGISKQKYKTLKINHPNYRITL